LTHRERTSKFKVHPQQTQPMAKHLHLSDLAKLSNPERAEAVRELARSALSGSSGEMKVIEARIRDFERRFEMKSCAMKRLLEAGAIQETAEIASWLIALDAKRRMLGREA
jgi:hypothetical protein